ncbi:MAG TPA: hypothetical protein VNU45_01335 [Rummeliibacillus sp.]|nr:hypothetical protein [Rummeliibacillus sp.]
MKIDRKSKLSVKEAINCYPKILQDAACTITALPTIQVNVGSLFSALKIIKSDPRTSLKEDFIDEVSFLRTIV